MPVRPSAATWLRIASVAILVGACSPAATASPVASSPASPTATASAVAVVPSASIEPVTIDFWQIQFEPYQQTWFKDQVDAFNASHGPVTVKYTVVPGDQWDTKLTAARAAGNQPDVVTTAYGQIRNGVKNGQYAALDGAIDAAAIADIAPAVKDLVTIDGKVYAYPMLVEPSVVLYYRKDLFEAAGLDPNAPPATWDALIDAARKTTKSGVYGINVAQTAPDLSWSTWGLQVNAAGHLPINADWSAPAASDTAYRPLANLYRTLYKDQLMPPEATTPVADITPYGEGKVAMAANGSWAIGLLKSNFPDVFAKTGIAAFPSSNGDRTKPTATLGGWTLTVDAKSDAPAAAATFIGAILGGSDDGLGKFFGASAYSKFPARTSVATAVATAAASTNSPYVSVISDQIVQYAIPEPAYPFDVSLAFGTALEAIMKGGDADKAFADADKAIADVIAKQKLAGTAP